MIRLDAIREQKKSTVGMSVVKHARSCTAKNKNRTKSTRIAQILRRVHLCTLQTPVVFRAIRCALAPRAMRGRARFTDALYCIWIILSILFSIVAASVPTQIVQAQDGRIRWTEKFNLSDTATTSTEPILLSDPAGYAYLFWSEDVGGSRSKFTGSGNTLFCVAWDGESWSEPIDVVMSPQSGNVLGHRAILDDSGTIHLIWFGDTPTKVFYSNAPASEGCQDANVWSPPLQMAEKITATEFSIALAYEAPHTLHVIYARGPQGLEPLEPRGVSYLKSTDNGLHWSIPLDIYVTPDPIRGASNTQLTLLDTHTLFATWTEWDESGNGQSIYFSKSTDSGVTWGRPQELARSTPLDYENDWLSIVSLPNSDRIAAIWEGGGRAYRQMRLSEDGGQTWSEQRRILDELIGENGYTEFFYDGAGRLHLFLANRGIGGRFLPSQIGLYHSIWEGNRWRPPELLQGINPMVNPKVAIVNGNQFVAAWYSSTNEEELDECACLGIVDDEDVKDPSPVGDIIVMTGELDQTPYLDPVSLPSATPRPKATPLPTLGPVTPTPTSTRPPMNFDLNKPSENLTPNPGMPLLTGMILPALLVAGCVVFQRLRQRAAQ